MKRVSTWILASLMVSGAAFATSPQNIGHPATETLSSRPSLPRTAPIETRLGWPRRVPFFAPLPAGTGTAWSWANPSPQGNTLYGSVTGTSLSVAVGGGGTVYTGTASGTWTQQNSGTTDNLYAVTYGDGLYVAVGQADTILTSPDGIHWTVITVSDTTQNLYSVAYDGSSTFVAAGTNGTVFYSHGGVTWSEGDVVASGSTDTATSVAFGSGTFVIVAHTILSQTNLFTSTDGGVVWSLQTIPALGDPSVYAAYNGSEFVAMGLNVNGTTGGSVMTSTNGVTWTTTTSPFPTTSFPIAITTAGTTFVAILQSGKISTNVTTPIDIETSPDGATWTPAASNNLPATWSQNIPKQISYAAGGYLVVGDDGYIATAANLQSWTPLSPIVPVTYNHLRGIHWFNHQFIAVGDDDTVLTSANGIAWTSENITGGTPSNLRDVAYNGTRYVSVGSNGTVLTSTDAINWTAAQITPAVPSGTSFEDLTWNGSLFVAVGTSGVIYSSPDGLTWTQQSSGTSDNLWGIAWTGARFVVVSDSTTDAIRILVSSDGVHWTSTAFNQSSATSLFGIHWTGTELVAAGGAANASGQAVGIIATSPDGINWTVDYSSAPAIQDIFADAILNGNQYVAVGQDTGYVYASPNGINWTVQTPTFQNAGLEKLAIHGGQLVTTGYAGVLLYSTDPAPTASNGTLSAAEDKAANGTLSASDATGLALTYAIVTPPTHGTATITDTSTGAFTYTPTTGFSGADSFTFDATDGTQSSAAATEAVTVNASSSTPPGGHPGGSGSSGGGGGSLSLVSLMVLASSATLRRKRPRQGLDLKVPNTPFIVACARVGGCRCRERPTLPAVTTLMCL